VRGVAAAGGQKPPAWWRVVALWQWLLAVVTAVGVVAAVAIAVDHLTGHHQGLISEASLIPWLLALAAALLVLGFLTAVGCRNMTLAAAEREREEAAATMRERVSEVTRELVLVPTGHEITQYEQFRRELALASAVLSPLPSRLVAPASGNAERTGRRPPSVRNQMLGSDFFTCRGWPSRRS
jgi:hypothetical protein